MDDLLERILKEEISDWKSLEEVYLSESFSQDNLVSLCCQWRDKFETPLCFVERMIKEFSYYQVLEETTLRWLSYNIWLGKSDLSQSPIPFKKSSISSIRFPF
ncbi:hypothetical protein NBO_575g0001 [Nosema bombycis CQ1]|uniref:Uncharacterized protein n=1 Tax=Nosema bombycis (strain CQ1 / CVCC 102059) TaxID=578461 RepID=R0MD96_NOSB1|nr:hypothetical protein NBO_575g0001 [Nosema bombycis CQ1]|eukprot:EOB12045.1 hypothetical protein NBO_575g0001 [Nosema bombycis CQ1]